MSVNQGDNNGGAVAGSFTLSAQLPDGKSLTFSGYVLQGETQDQINEKMDVVALAVERQRMAAEIPELEKKLSAMKDAKDQHEKIHADLSTKDRPNSQEKASLKQALTNIDFVARQIEKGEAQIAFSKRVLGVA